MNIAFLDMKAAHRELQGELLENCRRVLESGQYILGEEVELFEREFAAYCGVRYAVGVGNAGPQSTSMSPRPLALPCGPGC